MNRPTFTFSSLIILLLSIIALPISTHAQSDGDTTVVQTFTFGSPQNAWFQFPPSTERYQKILMLYTLKCNPAQNPACGEWDYTTNTFLYQHTGNMDSTLLSQPSYIVNNSSPDSFQYMTGPSYRYVPHFEYHIVYDSVISLSYDTFGVGGINTTQTLNTAFTDGKAQYLLAAQDLINSGVTAGNVTGLWINFSALGSPMNNLTLKLKNSNANAIDTSFYETTGFTTVYSARTSADSIGWKHLAFTQPFVWDGASNVVVEFDFDNNGTGTDNTLLADSVNAGLGVFAGVNDHVLSFDRVDNVSVPAAAFANIDSQITISLWQFGDSIKQPQDDIIFEGYDNLGNRVLNCHLPWSDSNVYWDAGNNGSGYDRLNKSANATMFKGAWNNWAFTKDASTGVMNIYLNGHLFATIGGKHNSMAGVVKFRIGSSANDANYFYSGMINEFQIWNTVLDSTTLQQWMNKDIDASHPYYSNLQAYYKFDEGTGQTTADASGHNLTAQLLGLPEWHSLYHGDNVRNLQNTQVRPYMIWDQGVYHSHIDSVLVIDTIENAQVSIIEHLDSAHATTATDTLYVWPIYYNNYVYDANGHATDSTLVAANNTIHLHSWPYYSAPFEVVVPYEIGRFITPYGIGLDLGTGWTWVYDVSDYRPLLSDSVQLSAGNWQELLDVKFLFIKGTPPRDVIKIQNVWDGDFYLNTFAQTVLPKTFDLDPDARMFRLKTRASGHGWDNPTNCAEFCPKNHTVSVNGFPIKTWTLLKDCGFIPLFPQGGTWLIDRAGWCPGEKVQTFDHEITPYLPANPTQATVSYEVEQDANGFYTFHSQFIQYSAPNFTQDAAITDVVAPSNQSQYTRYNPVCDNPIVIIQNTGADTLRQLDIAYGVNGGRDCYYTWTGKLAFLETDTIALPNFDWHSDDTTGHVFHANVDFPNGGVDGYPYNNHVESAFNTVPLYDTVMVMQLVTNAAGAESSWDLRDNNDSIIYSGSGYPNNTTIRDTFHIAPGCYKFTLYDSGEDGLSFFANNDGNGSCRLRKLGTGTFITLQPNFGEKITQYFMAGYAQGLGPALDSCVKPTHVIDTTGLVSIPKANKTVFVYPNPADNRFFVRLNFDQLQDADIRIFNSLGALVDEKLVKQAGKELLEFPIGTQSTGIYIVSVTTDSGTTVKRLVISR